MIMRKVFLHISALVAVFLLCLACSSDGVSVIPRSKLAKIYAEMLVMDQWAQSESQLRSVADTSLVYEPIFQKYGYDTEDYTSSVEYYMQDPERFSKILRETIDILDERISELNTLKKAIRRQKEIESFVTDFDISEFYPYLSEEPYVHYYDSLTVEADSFKVYRIVPIEREDTIFDRLVMIIRVDSLALDSLVVDTLVKDKPVFKKIDVKEPEILPLKKEDQENVARKPQALDDPRRIIRKAKFDTLKLK
jgi:hypothetical protein